MDTAADQCTCGGGAWIILEETGEEVMCSGYIREEGESSGQMLKIVSAATCVTPANGEPFILIVHQACYHDDPDQNESLCLPYQAEQHGVKFDLTPKHRLNANGDNGKQLIIIEDKEIDLEFDGRKMFIKIRLPTGNELTSMPSYELTSPSVFIPDCGEENEDLRTHRRKHSKRCPERLPGGIPLLEWRKRLAYAPEDVVMKTFSSTTQLAMNVEAENRMSGRRHYKPRFAFLREHRLNDVFHSDTFFPTVRSNTGDTCSQIFLGKNTDYMKVYPLRKESNSFQALQDFTRGVGIPMGIKTDNATTEVGAKWTAHCRENRIDTKFTEPYSPWQNYSEHGIYVLGRMVSRCMREFNAPLSRHQWCQKWCCDVKNHLASRKLNWRTPEEKLTGNTPDISVFRFHFWQRVEYYDPTVKQPNDGWVAARFLGIAWDSGDIMTYYVEPENQTGKPSVLVRSTVRARDPVQTPDIQPSGESITDEETEQELYHRSNDRRDKSTVEETNDDANGEDNMPGDSTLDSTVDQDDIDQTWSNEIDEQDDACVSQQIQDELIDDVEDFEFHHIRSHKWEDGILVFDVELCSGKNYDVPFNLIKKDRPIETAKYIRNNVVENKRGGIYEQWAKKIIKNSVRTIRRLHRCYNTDKYMRARKNVDLAIRNRRVSKNSRDQGIKNREKFGIRIPNSVKEALLLDRMNKKKFVGRGNGQRNVGFE